jgi:hypothetical protein
MKKAMINYIQKEKFDNLYTPYHAITPLLKYLPLENKGNITIWECCDSGNSKITELLKKEGFNVVSTDIETGFNFLTDTPDFEFDMIITNPPYSLKTEFIKKCYEYGKPFALLLPLTGLEGVERNIMYREYGISVLVLDRRISYQDNRKSNWFNTSWFCGNGLLPKNTLVFEEVVENYDK